MSAARRAGCDRTIRSSNRSTPDAGRVLSLRRLPPRSLLFGVPKRPGSCRRDRAMKTVLSFGALVLAISTTTISAEAKDCLKGGSAGSVRGAIGGCYAGHYIAMHRQQDGEKEPPAGGGPVPALPPGQNPAPADSSTVTADAAPTRSRSRAAGAVIRQRHSTQADHDKRIADSRTGAGPAKHMKSQDQGRQNFPASAAIGGDRVISREPQIIFWSPPPPSPSPFW